MTIAIADEPVTAALVVKKWEEIQDAAFKALGLNKDEVIADLKEPLDGHETSCEYMYKAIWEV